MTSDVAPEYALVIEDTTEPAVPNPGGAVVSRAPKTCTLGQFVVAAAARAAKASRAAARGDMADECADAGGSGR
jgi:hypothetical protein